MLQVIAVTAPILKRELCVSFRNEIANSDLVRTMYCTYAFYLCFVLSRYGPG
jgi:hypothetical protein